MKTRNLTQSQAYMLATLQTEKQGCDHLAMSIHFGRKWKEVWANLKEKGLVNFVMYAKDGRCYRAKTSKQIEAEKIVSTVCSRCGDPALPETYGFDPLCPEHCVD
jgi:hypothetical protein